MTVSANYPTVSPSLLLDFASERALDPRVTFSRSTTATYYDGVTNALAEQNLIKYSQGTGMAANWGADSGGQSTRVNNAVAAPDGTTTAMSFTSLGGYANMSQNITAVAGTYTLSFYAQVPSGTYAFSGGSLSITGTITTTWQRFTATATVSAPTTIYLFNSVPNAQVIYVWGVQLEQRSSATAYNATTAQAINNYIPQLLTASSNQPRFDCNPTTSESLGLFIEQQSTNLVTYSGAMQNWLYNSATYTATANIAPDGTQSATLLIPNTFYNNHYVTPAFATISVGTTYTYSVYAKAYGYGFIFLQGITGIGNYPKCWFNLSNGTVGTNSGYTAAITSVGNGWYRCSITYLADTGGASLLALGVASADGTQGCYGDGYSGVYIWGGQVEAASFSTSYIPTTSAAATRTVDSASMTGTNFSSWYNISQGCLYSEYTSSITSLSAARPFSIGDTTVNNQIGMYSYAGANQAYVSINNTVQANISNGTFTAGSFAKSALLYKTNDIELSGNGITPTIVTTATIPPVTGAYIGWTGIVGTPQTLNGRIKKVAYYPQALSGSQLQALTGS